MKYYQLFAFATLVMGCLFFAEEVQSKVIEHRYKEVTGDKKETFTWTMIPGDKIRLISTKEEEVTSLLCRPDGTVLKWHHTDENGTELEAARSSDVLHVSGKKQGNVIVKRYELDEHPWFQFLSFSLQSFLRNESAQKSTFWMLRPDSLEPILLEATKLGTELIKLDSNTIRAAKVRISPHGVFSSLWQAHYWYRLPDLLFIMYRGVHGGPFTPETVISLEN